MPRSKVKTGHLRLTRNKLSYKLLYKKRTIFNKQYYNGWTTNIPGCCKPFRSWERGYYLVSVRFRHLLFPRYFRGKLRASKLALEKKKKKERKKEKNSDRPIPRKLFRRLPFLNAIHSVNKKEERLDTMVAGYYLLANYTWARSGGEFPSRLQ